MLEIVLGQMRQELVMRPVEVATFGIFTLALINAGLAQSKNRSGLGWFLLSLILGPLATFFLVAFCSKLPESQ